MRTHNNKLQFIQIWRALAVIAVILYHYFPEIVPRGYLGVDLFFVISGYVIAASFNNYDKEKKSSYLTFLAARVNRLIPTLVLVLTLLTIFTIFFASPISAQYETFSGILANFFGVSNLYFYRKPSGYFNSPLEFSSVLHTWSLSLEWQFYILIILVSLVVVYLQKKFGVPVRIELVYLVIAISSLLLTSFQFFTNSHLPGLSNPVKEQLFFLPFQRVYQFLFGAFLALCRPRFKLKKIKFDSYRVVLQIFLLTFFILFVVTHPRTHTYDFAGSILVVIIACLSIILGDFKIYKPLTSLIPVGNSSYSLYLWHWPILLFVKLYLGDTVSLLCVGILLTFFLSFLSYRFLENNRNFSKASGSLYRNSIQVFCSYLGLMIVVAFLMIAAKNYYWNQDIKTLAVTQEDRSKFGVNCWTYPEYVPSKFKDCRFPVSNQSGWVLLVGDSHAYSVSDGIQEFYKKKNLGIISYPLCDVSDNSLLCQNYLKEALKVAKHNDVKLIVFTGRISRQLTLNKKEVVMNNRLSWISNVESLDKEWLYILDVPNIGADPCGGFGWWRQEHSCKQKIELMSSIEMEGREIEEFISKNYPSDFIFDPWDVFCDNRSCSASAGSTKLYLDDNHLNLHGSLYLAKFLDRN